MQERPFDYSFQVSMADDATLDNQSVSVSTDSAFELRALCCTKTGTFRARLRDGQGRQMSDNLIQDANLFGTRQSPVPVYPPIIIPAGGRIGVDLANDYAGTNAIELVFIGAKLTQ